MTTVTWIIAGFAVVSLLLGVVATIVTRINHVPNWRMMAKVLYWIIGLLLFKLLVWSIFGHLKEEEKKSDIQQQVKQAVEARVETYEWYWKLPEGLSSDGRNETAIDERIVESIPRNDGSIWVDQHYKVYGKPEIQRIRLYRTGDKTWEGTCDQDNPESHRRLSLIETSPGIYAGKITWEDGKEGICYLKKRK